MKMVVGLGNPGPKYRRTRHNLGFDVLDEVARRLNLSIDREKHRGLLAETRLDSGSVLFVKPLTYMNLSGECVAAAARNKVYSPEDILVVVDDVNLPLGRVRIRAGGSAGGHNGLKSIIERIGSPDFPRLRLGVGNDANERGLADYVLSRFRPEEQDTVQAMITRAAEAVFSWLDRGIEPTMNEFNR